MREGFKKSILGEIPLDWKILKVGDLGKVITGNTPKAVNKEHFGKDFPWITPSDINGSKNITDSTRKLSSLGISVCRRLPANSVLVTCIASIGKNAILRKDGSCNQQINAIPPSDKFNSDFLFYVFEANTKRLQNLAGTTAVPIINKTTFESFPVVLPPLPEQQKIADILSTVDEKIELIDQQIAETEALKKGLMQRLLTKWIGHTEFKDSPLGKIPKSWSVTRIGKIAHTTAGGTPSTNKSEYWNGNIPWMSSGDINMRRVKGVNGRITELGLNNSSTKIIPKNSVLMALAGQGKTRGKVAINEIDLCTNQSLASMSNFKNTSSEFIFHNLESRYSEIRKMSTGDGGRGGLNLKIINAIQIALPPYEEQLKIAEIFNSIDAKQEKFREKKTEYQNLIKGLMQKLLTGKIRVNTLVEA